MSHIKIIVIGAGGTGGHLYDRLARLAYGHSVDPNKTDLNLTLVDGDIVEESNLLRQNFTFDDLGLNKAKALTDRYLFQMNVEGESIETFFTSPDQITSLFDASADLNIIVGAVDNNTARFLIDQAMSTTAEAYNVIWLDSGNLERLGQVIVSGSLKALRLPEIQAFDPNTKLPKSPFEKYPDSFMNFSGLNGDVTQLSCELAAVSAPQNIATNIIAADTVFLLINKIISGEILTEYEYKFDTSAIGVVPAKD